jgi:hypothetical protein
MRAGSRGWILVAILGIGLVSSRPQGEEEDEEEDEGGDDVEYDYDLVGADGGISNRFST